MAIKRPPMNEPVKGNYNLYGIAMKWTDNPGNSLSSVKSSCKKAAAIYKSLSNGHYNFNVIAKAIQTGYAHEKSNLSKAEARAKKIAVQDKPNTNPDIWAMFNNKCKKVSTGAGNTAHLIGTLTRDVCHELGHCRPLVLGHAGKFVTNKKGQQFYEAYGDGTTFMGRFPSTKLSAPHLWLLGWVPEHQVVMYEYGDDPVEYNIEEIAPPYTSDNIKVIYIPRADKSPLFLSRVSNKQGEFFALHQLAKRTSQRLAVFKEAKVFEGLMFERIDTGKGFVVVRVSTVET